MIAPLSLASHLMAAGSLTGSQVAPEDASYVSGHFIQDQQHTGNSQGSLVMWVPYLIWCF